MVDTFDRDFKFEVTHISLAKKADVILVAPATANVIAKMAHGIADDMLTTTGVGCKVPQARFSGHEYRNAGKPHHAG